MNRISSIVNEKNYLYVSYTKFVNEQKTHDVYELM